MYEWSQMTMTEIDALDRQLPVIVPIGLIESHGPHIATYVDTEGAVHFSRKVCEATGSILLPPISYGYIGEMRDYPGTVGVTSETLSEMILDVLDCLARQGFMKVVFISGHVANNRGVELGIEKAQTRYHKLKAAYWVYWSFAGVPMKHADKIETEFAMLTGTRVDMSKAKDFDFKRPWHAVWSRHDYVPDSGGVQGPATQAKAEDSKADYEKVLSTLIDMTNKVKNDLN